LPSDAAVLACFWEFFFCVAFGDLSPIGMSFSRLLARIPSIATDVSRRVRLS
jgi:hypothetical protein